MPWKKNSMKRCYKDRNRSLKIDELLLCKERASKHTWGVFIANETFEWRDTGIIILFSFEIMKTNIIKYLLNEMNVKIPLTLRILTFTFRVYKSHTHTHTQNTISSHITGELPEAQDKNLVKQLREHNPDMGDPTSSTLRNYKVTQDERSRSSGKRRTWKVLSVEHWDPSRFQSTKLCSGNGGETNFQTETQIKVPLSLDQPCDKCLADPHISFTFLIFEIPTSVKLPTWI